MRGQQQVAEEEALPHHELNHDDGKDNSEEHHRVWFEHHVYTEQLSSAPGDGRHREGEQENTRHCGHEVDDESRTGEPVALVDDGQVRADAHRGEMKAQREVADDVQEDVAENHVGRPVAGQRLDPRAEILQEICHFSIYRPIVPKAAQ